MRKAFLKNLWERITINFLVRSILLLVLAWGIVRIIDYFGDIIAIFSFATILAFLLHYPARYLSRFFPYNLAAIVVFLSALLLAGTLLVGIGLKVLSQGQQLIDSMTDFIGSIASLFERSEAFLNKLNIQVNLNAVQRSIQDQLFVLVNYIVSNLQSTFQNILGLIITLVVAFFMLLEGENLWNSLLKLLPENRQQKFTKIVKDNFLGFFLGQILLCLFLITATFIIFVFLQTPFPLLLACIAGIFDLIPGIGATLGVSTVVLILLAQNVGLALKALIACIVLQQIQDNLIAPKVMQNTIELNPVVAFFALLVGAKIAGLPGVFLSLPIAGVIASWWKSEGNRADKSEVINRREDREP
ncbi:AI-2E family transporter [Pannus brasiliensis CCIBt3594]|uniref:AI-2E family transporter n=1 Tax=Pannus brasiliensis CCIBt3594 TaxID=1427578 RepID=A0AAW9QHI6_9CHRO